MKISLKWLHDYVDVTEFFQKPEVLAEALTRGGLEVEEITNRAKDFNHVVIGHILEKDKHPNADKLSLCRVSTGEGVVHQIVCGAQNHKAGDRVIVALPGAVLPGNFAIKKSAVRGVDSAGMLCSLKELGLATESEGIAILPADAPVGKAYAEYGGYDDVTFELKVTANRADCLSHFGLAREVSTLFGKELKVPSSELKTNGKSSKSEIALDVKAFDLCPRYAGRFLKGVKVGPSPAWLKARLESVGMNSINNIVDVTNYVMLELGQPLHAFDAAFINGKKIIVDRAVAGEKFITLDGTEIALNGAELTIRDVNHPVCLAGVVGGKNSGVSDSTTEVFLEAAYFLPMSARKTSRSHGIDTDSSYRFARGVDPDGTLRGLNRAAALILEVAGGEAYADHHDFYPNPVKKAPVDITIKTVSDRLGYEAEEHKFVDFMKRLGCEINKKGETFTVLPPTFRFDIEQDMDLVEEYARLNGYEHIPEALPALAAAPSFQDKTFMLNRTTSELLRGEGFQQAVNFAFVGSKAQKAFLGSLEALKATGLAATEKEIRILNPLNEEMDVMRSSLSFGLFKNLNHNFHSGNMQGRLFEIGSTFFVKDDGSFAEGSRAGMAIWGRASNLWNKSLDYPVVYELKAAVEVLLKSLNISSYTWVTPANKSEVPEFLHQGQFAQLLVEGKKVGFIGTLHPLLLEDNKIRVPAALAELDLDQLYKGQPRPYRIQSVSKFPIVERDFAFVMPKALKVGDVLKDIRKAGAGLLLNVDVFDLYEGEKMEAGKKSVAIRIWLQDKNATLQETQINETTTKILESLKKNFDLSVR
ncbi:phenylalanine--tRNA ligase subunit beta [Bdellovibrio bacteriovorus]|uniref:Phenylalanine--tRNA ligase beta subunit n=1 Tax=Bdellovibrio bacteriovorus (strain ATCC 15356 / DSM 50701 / NCIMB 9529 / HD100) TaxID=264462 RepID=SYFB_BDEBA|nr:phenylalanine--tRNA ligase subunit beta [Bdellovibrio bacteriovorus]Q6MMJ1.1 RecName: Full=Phenylalanine--tRNA ligase beta subunit; AltName: Full=Phenylalanyl-tRNA synthetase beta subunit; Short=PheRS [Bdellovibrio bacteriovorus HD100]AHZ84182.1 phenylalanyl-tRNA synthetase subunit beta [Bdellovibrio bacteriovorus]BEV68066.1 Phenylalanine--tRNA ligase beta subunit [Bdellovibrio bacteriovorus]CAE79513.1 phenylalanyl-tRNA synthetase beta chain [Bdellovibrio bacteriovorus HD100]